MSKYDVEINGDNKGLTVAVNKSMEELNKLDEAANGLFGNLTGPLNNLKGGMNVISTMSPALKGLGAAGLAASAGLMAINKASSIIEPLNQISTTTGVSIEMLQQLQKEFKNTGMEAQEFGDINKDAMDKLGDSFREGGGGVADDLEKWGIELKSLTKYAGDAEGGIKAVIDVYYQMQKAGKSQAEIVNAMESMASNSSHLISTLQQHSNAQEALNSIQAQSVTVTSEVAAEFQEWERNTKSLGKAVDDFTVESVGPLVRELNNVWKWVDGMDWSDSKFAKWLKENNEKGMSPTGMSSGQVANAGKTVKAIEAEKRQAFIAEQAKFLQQDIKITKEKLKQERQAAEAQKAIDDKNAADAKTAADKAAREREKAARESKAAYDKMMADRKAAMQSLATLDLSIINSQARGYASQSNQVQASLTKLKELREADIISQEQYQARKKAIIANSSDEFGDSLRSNPAELGNIVKGMQENYESQKQQIQIQRKQGLIDQKAYDEQIQNLEIEHQAKMAEIKTVNPDLVNMQNLSAVGFATDEQEMALQQERLKIQFAELQSQNKSMYESGILDHDKFLKQKERLDQAYAIKSQNISLMETKTRMGMYDDFAQGMAGITSGLLGENSKAANAMFAVSQGTSIAMGMLNAYESATAAMAKYPGPLGYAMAAGSYAKVMGQVMAMKSISPQGMAHDGIDNVPTEGTWLLDGGERVVDQRTNGDLKDFLDNNKQGGEQVIDARITVQGNVTDQRWFAEQLKKQQQSIAAMVKDQNRRKM